MLFARVQRERLLRVASEADAAATDNRSCGTGRGGDGEVGRPARRTHRASLSMMTAAAGSERRHTRATAGGAGSHRRQSSVSWTDCASAVGAGSGLGGTGAAGACEETSRRASRRAFSVSLTGAGPAAVVSPSAAATAAAQHEGLSRAASPDVAPGRRTGRLSVGSVSRVFAFVRKVSLCMNSLR